MIVKDFHPSLPLKEYINQYRVRHFVFENSITPTVKPFPPRPEQCLTFYVRGSETSWSSGQGIKIKKPRCVISGQYTFRVDRFVSYPEILMIIVDFKPGALYRLTGIPFKKFTNQDVDAEALFPYEIIRVNHRLNSTESYVEMIQIIENFLICLVQKSNKQIMAIDHVMHVVTKESDHSIDWLARNSYLSHRQLERKFDERIGISPKTFMRISRFNKSYWLHLKNPNLSWFQIAMCCGYTDYQHLVKEYKEFANANPNCFFAEESKAPGRMLGLTK